MSAITKTTVLKARSGMDRQLAKIEASIVWDHSGQSVRENLEAKDRLAELADRALAIGEIEGNTPTIQLRAISVAKECLEAASNIRTGTIIDRTIPSLSRSELTAVLANLPASREELLKDEPIERDIAAARRLLAERFGPKRLSGGNGIEH